MSSLCHIWCWNLGNNDEWVGLSSPEIFISYWGTLDSKPNAFTMGLMNAVVDVHADAVGKTPEGTLNLDWCSKKSFLDCVNGLWRKWIRGRRRCVKWSHARFGAPQAICRGGVSMQDGEDTGCGRSGEKGSTSFEGSPGPLSQEAE